MPTSHLNAVTEFLAEKSASQRLAILQAFYQVSNKGSQFPDTPFSEWTGDLKELGTALQTAYDAISNQRTKQTFMHRYK